MKLYQDKVFPFLNDLVSQKFVEHRKNLLTTATGEILEVGFGSGSSLESYPRSVHSVTGIEPNQGMIARYRQSDMKTHVNKIEIIEGFAESLPFENETFDGVSSFLTLCSVSNLNKTLSEIKRVLKPGGNLFLIEHIAQKRGSLTRRIQDFIQPYWKIIGCGCNCNRETIVALEAAGFYVKKSETLGYDGFPNFLAPIKACRAALLRN